MPNVNREEFMAALARVEVLEEQHIEMRRALLELRDCLQQLVKSSEKTAEMLPYLIAIHDAVKALGWVGKAIKYMGSIAGAAGAIYAAASGKITGLFGI